MSIVIDETLHKRNMEIIRLDNALAAMTARAEKAEQELERQAWKISPAMAQAQIDQLNARAEKAEAKLKIAVEALTRLIYMESAAVALAKIDAIERGEAT